MEANVRTAVRENLQYSQDYPTVGNEGSLPSSPNNSLPGLKLHSFPPQWSGTMHLTSLLSVWPSQNPTSVTVSVYPSVCSAARVHCFIQTVFTVYSESNVFFWVSDGCYHLSTRHVEAGLAVRFTSVFWGKWGYVKDIEIRYFWPHLTWLVVEDRPLNWYRETAHLRYVVELALEAKDLLRLYVSELMLLSVSCNVS